MTHAIAVVGAGAWGTALAVLQHGAGRRVRLWARDPLRAAAIAAGRANPRLPGVTLPAGIEVTNDLARAVDGAEAVLLVVPVQHMRAVAAALPPEAGPLVVCGKGMEAGTLRLPLEILAETCPGRPAAVLGGPNFAAEIAAGLPAAAVLGAADAALRARLVAMLAAPSFRLYGNADAVGAQVGGAAKNVIAIAAGVVIGAGFGENARAALVTRGLAELSRLAAALGGRAQTVMGLSGLGDLILTCTGERSRNFSLGQALGRGQTLAEILGARSAVTEGVATAPALLARAGGADMPITAAVVSILEGAATPRQAAEALLSRRLRDE
ncbi:MAG: NAD(P)-dependent glycerol-3-phosphate dehydrogenase [Proteobacteria bacterium]|nr:NAD(P)-dependent glycerol-3-phosphate dehydrogenase [Pseudomonadota bacterium]